MKVPTRYRILSRNGFIMSIKMELYETEIAEVERGQTLAFNHTDCPAGQDTRRRLYFTRPASTVGVVLAFCHNCQESGVIRNKIDPYRNHVPTAADHPYVPDTKFEVPSGLIEDPSMWPHDALVWKMLKKLTDYMVTTSGISYDPSTNRIYLPMYDRVCTEGDRYGSAVLLGYQLRQIDGKGPKYYTALRDSNIKPYTIFYDGKVSTRVLVEDLASGIVLSHALMGTPHGVVVNYGVKVTPEILHECRHIRRGLVWLDNDGDIIKEQAKTIARTWELISGKPVRIESELSDPKNYDVDTLRKTVEGRS